MSSAAGWFEVSGHCMAPLIRKGDLVMVVPIAELRVGDIVLAPGSPPVVHRVLRVDKGGRVLTKGDMSALPDPPLTRADLIGKVAGIARKGGRPVSLEGRLWRMENSLMARYSLACCVIWVWASRHGRLTGMLHRWATPLRRIYVSVARFLTTFLTARQG